MIKKSDTQIYIGTSGWHYDHWIGLFYPDNIKGYYELKYLSVHFNTVENNSSFYRIASESTYKTWDRMTPEGYNFSIKLNKVITHIHRLKLNDEVKEKLDYILNTTQILGNKLGTMLIQLPPSFKPEIKLLDDFLKYLIGKIKKLKYKFDVAIEFRNKENFNEAIYKILEKYNVALVAGQSSRYPEIRRLTADFTYIRMHGPTKLFSSKYNETEIQNWAKYIKSVRTKVKKIYVYFNNDFHGYALENAKDLQKALGMYDENNLQFELKKIS